MFCHDILRSITAEVQQASMLSQIVDETSDISTKEEVSITVRIVTMDSLEPQEVLLGLYETGDTYEEKIALIIEDADMRPNLSLQNCRVQ